MPAPYNFIALTVCIDASNRVLMVRESRPDCRGQFYVPAGRGNLGEDPMHIAWRVTAEKTGLSIEPDGIMGIEHNPPVGQFPGQLRVWVRAHVTTGSLKVAEDEHSMAAAWVPYDDVRQLKLRSDDFLTWLDDAMLGQAPVMPAAFWRAIGVPH